MRVSEMVCELPKVRSLTIDPIMLDDQGALAVNAVVEIQARAARTSRYGHMTIHPYPPGLETSLKLRDGREVSVRPIRPEDTELEQAFVDGLSDESRYFRFMGPLGRITPLMLARFTQIDYDREMALVAVSGDNTDAARILAAARYVGDPDGGGCEFALTVADEYQRQGIGRRLMDLLIRVARDRGLTRMQGDVLRENKKMLGAVPGTRIQRTALPRGRVGGDRRTGAMTRSTLLSRSVLFPVPAATPPPPRGADPCPPADAPGWECKTARDPFRRGPVRHIAPA